MTAISDQLHCEIGHALPATLRELRHCIEQLAAAGHARRY
jgi:hypothetical protein